MKDVSRAELSGKSYTSFGRKDGIPSTLVIIYQLPGANAIQTVDNLQKLLDGGEQELSAGPAVPDLARYHEVREGGDPRGGPGAARRHHPGADRGVHLPR